MMLRVLSRGCVTTVLACPLWLCFRKGGGVAGTVRGVTVLGPGSASALRYPQLSLLHGKVIVGSARST